jgi:hypothetical protein
METPSDFKDLLALFNAQGVEYLLVGGYALAFHGAPRFTGDLDIFVKPSPENAQRIMAAINQFGFASTGLGPADFNAPDKVVQLGVPPVRIDVMTSLTGVSWEEAWSGRVKGTYAGLDVFYIGIEEFVKNKRSLGRQRDIADLEALGRAG